MVTIQEKLNLFSKLVYQDLVDSQYKELKMIEQENNQYIENFKNELEKRVDDINFDINNKIIQKKNEMISKANLEVKHKILLKKQEFVDILINELITKAYDFTNTSNYYDYFKKSYTTILDKLWDKKIIQIELLNKDRQRFQVLIEELSNKKGISPNNISYIDARDSIIGGLIVSDKEAQSVMMQRLLH